MRSLRHNEIVLYSLDDDVESLFYTFLAILSDGKLTWEKGISLSDLACYKVDAAYYGFRYQLHHVSDEFHHIVLEFRDLLFDGPKRKPVDVDAVINFLSFKANSAS